jgi:hypothetical protein
VYRAKLHSPLISFDLDDTLICYHPATPREPVRVPWPLHPWFREPLRAGTADLMRELLADGWKIAVYTTSHRSSRYVAWLLRFHGVRVSLVVNQRAHERALARAGMTRGPSKLPRLFGIRLHVDDSDGVAEEGMEYGFDVVVVRPDDGEWARNVLAAARTRMPAAKTHGAQAGVSEARPRP